MEELADLFGSAREAECSHEKKMFPDGNGYCVFCGENFIKNTECQHPSKIEDNGAIVCDDCGAEIETISLDPEWRNYSKTSSSRCNTIKSKSKAVDCLNGVPASIRQLTMDKYEKVTEGITFKGDKRNRIIAACLFFAYQEFGQYRITEYIREKIGVTQKSMSHGLNEYYKKFEEDRVKVILPENLVHWFLKKSSMETRHYSNICKLLKHIENTSSLINKSSPQTVVASVIYFYMCISPEYKSANKTKFFKNIGMSDVTVTRLAEEISNVTNCKIKLH